jgi:mitochondrial Rho GTPase 1
VWQVPVVLVGNKIDLRGGEVTNEALEEEILPIMNEFKVIYAHPVTWYLLDR